MFRRRRKKAQTPVFLTPGQARKGRRQRALAAQALYHAEVRAYVAKRAREGAHPRTVATELGVSRKLVETSMEHSLQRVADYERQRRGERFPDDPPLGGTFGTVTGEVLDPPEVRAFILQAFALRKRQLPYDEIADITGHTEQECRDAVNKRLRELEFDELSETSTARRMMLEQLDAMIAAITVPATGRDIDGNPAPVLLDAIDRMCRLLDQKAKLLGLNAPQRVDLTHRIEVMAEQSGYDVKELKQIAAEVLQAYNQPGKLR